MSVRGLDEEMVSLALDSGCLVFNLAIESASEETLKGIRKPVRPEEAQRVARIVKDRGGYLMGLFMLGFPEETEEQFRETIRFGKSLECDWTLYSCVTPFPGSELYDEAKAKGMLPEEVEHDFERLNFRNYVLRPRYLAPEFVEREAYFANLDQNFFENPNLRSGRTAIALSDFQNVVKLVPTHASVYYCIGRIHEERGHLDLAGHFYDLARQHLSGIHQEYFARASIIIP